MKNGKILRIILIIICLGTMSFSLWKLWEIFSEYRESKNAYNDLAGKYVKVEVVESELKKPNLFGGDKDTSGKNGTDSNVTDETVERVAEETMITVDFDALLKECPDVVG